MNLRRISHKQENFQPSAPRPDRLEHRQQIYADLEEVIIWVGAAQVFSNHQDIKKLLGLIQAKLFSAWTKFTPTPEVGTSSLGFDDVDGLRNCALYFSRELPPPSAPVRPSRNRAGSMLSLAKLSCQRFINRAGLMPELTLSEPATIKFIAALTNLFSILERYEYHNSNIEV